MQAEVAFEALDFVLDAVLPTGHCRKQVFLVSIVVVCELGKTESEGEKEEDYCRFRNLVQRTSKPHYVRYLEESGKPTPLPQQSPALLLSHFQWRGVEAEHNEGKKADIAHKEQTLDS